MPYQDRASFIALLERLGTSDEASVLEAAREIHRRVTLAETGWDKLLAREPRFAVSDRAEDIDDPDVDVSDFEIRDRPDDPSLEEPDAARLAMVYADELNLIRSLLARGNLSPATRRELLDLRTDIFADDFSEMDGTYLQELAARLDARSRDDER